MYSGTTLTKYSGRVMGAHQKIDRVARRHLTRMLQDNSVFPDIKTILHFEGKNGPDGIKRKSPAKDELWHYYNPFDEKDMQIIHIIEDHYNKLVKELKANNRERIAFEAAWLAHGIVDGLTPAHHFPYEEKLTELRGGASLESRTTIRAKLLMPGETPRERMKNNWKMWGPKGLFTTHGLFEMGVATLIAPLSFSDTMPKKSELERARGIGIIEYFKRSAREVAVWDMYDRYHQKGWTSKLAYDVRHKLGPILIQTVTIAWYMALIDAGKIEPNYENHRRKFRRKNVSES